MFGTKFFQLKKKKARVIEVHISSGLIKDKVIELLGMTNHILDKDEVIDVDFTMTPETNGVLPVKIYIKKEVSR